MGLDRRAFAAASLPGFLPQPDVAALRAIADQTAITLAHLL
jgi:hypothetical protein